MIVVVVVVVVVVIVTTTFWNTNMLEKRWSICQIRWDTIVQFYFTIYKNALAIKKG